MNKNNKKRFVSNSEESVRMFKSDFLESLSKVHFTIPIYLYLPVILYCIYRAASGNINLIFYPIVIIAGFFVWTLIEYIMHRFVFHTLLPGKIGARLHFIFHGVHHDYPSDRKRLVMPPSVSIPLALLFYAIFKWMIPEPLFWLFFSTFLTGYLVYDIGHYAMHHFNFKSGFFKKIKRYHMLHHYREPKRGYGVTSPIWDKVFSSGFSKNEKITKHF